MTQKSNIKIPVITGPTGSGKTSVALAVAEKFPIEIISVDSRQVYRFMNIGTAKPDEKELNRVPHHLIDIRNPDEDFNAGQFVDEVNILVPQILERGAIPLLVGGTAMYIWALEEGLFNAGETPQKIKDFLNKQFEENGLEALYQQLSKVDKETASKLHPNDKQRILRALEIYESTGKPLSYWKKETQKSFPYSLQKYIITPDRKLLYEKINKRVDVMIESGLEDEVKNLLNMGYSQKNNALRSVGYQEVIDCFEKECDRETMIEEIKKNTRRYAKRQLTWFRKYKGI
ncbi:MAG: tRNA (adenosine(37)-N6)-dimethylallyltransferase MiaA, partial [Calditrichia bacterium]|nr:tRNA (adenosine(37)-N6)-dimethylallyltransferase MiaA [Calditrichia bacterium]